MFYRPTVAFINLDHLLHNFRVIRRLAGPHSPLAPVVKSNAYGHGIIPIAQELNRAGAEWLAVSLTEEGLELRRHGITLNEAARMIGRPVPIHLKMETGLGRLGILPKDLPFFIQYLKEMPFILLEGICTSFSSVDDLKMAKEQIDVFERTAEDLSREFGRPLIRHIAHTGGLLRGLNRPGWVIRPGIMLYGYTRGLAEAQVDLKPVLTWRTEIYKVQAFPEGYPIGYSGLYRATKGSRIALLPIGYSDGLLRSYMGAGEVLICGKRAPLVGRFSMDWTMAEIGHIPGAKAGDEVILLGTQGREHISAEEMAARAKTIVDEVLVSIAGRVPRIPRKDGIILGEGNR